VRLEGEDSRCAAGILNAYRVGGLNPPSVDEALSAWRSAAHAREILDVLVFRGDLVKIAEGLLLSKEAVESAAQTAVEQIRENGRTTVGRMRDSLESSRKVMVPLMEYFDATHLTRRKGDERVLY
jgi:selenocysteine-specific elongation factor